MSGYGLKIINPSSELVISSDAKGLYCIGKAVLQGSVVQPTGVATVGNPGRRSGYSTYQIANVGPIVVALDLPLNKRVGIRNVAEVSSNVWNIQVHCGDSADAYNFDATEYALSVWAFGFAPSVLGSYGLALYNSSGALAYDLSRSNPLFPRSYHSGTNASYTIPALTRPVAIGLNQSDRISDDFVIVNRWAYDRVRGSLRRTSSTAMVDSLYAEQRYEYSASSSGGFADGDIYPTSTFIIEGNLLP